MKILNFTDLLAWKEARVLTLDIYKVTKSFPSDEKFALTNQIRRASISVISNIAEGFGRNTAKDKSQFYSMSKGSLLELQSQLIIATDLKYLDVPTFKKINQRICTTTRLIAGLMNSAMDKK